MTRKIIIALLLVSSFVSLMYEILDKSYLYSYSRFFGLFSTILILVIWKLKVELLNYVIFISLSLGAFSLLTFLPYNLVYGFEGSFGFLNGEVEIQILPCILLVSMIVAERKSISIKLNKNIDLLKKWYNN
ncbi:hypothetical protein [Reichenbachiella sp. MALMAid0571]|uniref:hypothetical protein n=1 Tax=Reichenbachiella sp. MALMAid0571 TaxID=3143939 RepID=UPI0032DE85AB